MNRLQILAKIDRLHDGHCKGCKYFDSKNEENTRHCKSCEIREQLQGLGIQLESIKKERKPLGEKKPVLDIYVYRDLKAKGQTDKVISASYGITQATLSYHKKKWFKDAVEPSLKVVEAKKEETPTKTIRREKEAELGSLVSELSEDIESKKETIAELEAKVKELENINAACSDVEEETNELREELVFEKSQKVHFQNQYAQTLNKLEKTDADLENHKQWMKTAGEELNRLQKENKHLWALIGLKAAELNG